MSNKPEHSLYHRLGGFVEITKVNDQFFQYMLQNPQVTTFYLESGANIAKMHDSMVDYMSMLTGGPNNYTGPELSKVHTHLKIRQEHFDALWQCMARAFKENGTDEKTIEELKVTMYTVCPHVTGNKQQ